MKENEIRMVDLTGQYEKIKSDIDDAINEVLNSTAFIKGPAVRTFENELQEYLSSGSVISCGNGTDALQVAMMALGLEPGDEVITTPFTFIATIEVISLLGLKPVLADILPDTFNINPAEIRKLIGPKTRAIVPVHLFGQCVDMEEILSIAGEHDLRIIEDAAQAIGTDFFFSSGEVKKAGTIGDIGTTSFFPSKNLGAFGDGGAIFTNDQALGDKIRAMVNHGMKRRYYYDYVGVNSRLDTLQAAILSVKLKHLDEYIKARQDAAAFYDSHLKGLEHVTIPARTGSSTHTFHQYTLKVADGRDELKEFLDNREIPSMIYYPLGLHLQDAYRNLGYRKGDFPVTEELSGQVLSLPMHTELDQNQLEYIVNTIIEFYN